MTAGRAWIFATLMIMMGLISILVIRVFMMMAMTNGHHEEFLRIDEILVIMMMAMMVLMVMTCIKGDHVDRGDASDDDDWDDHRDDVHDGDQVDDVGCGDRHDDHLENFSRIDDISIICRSSSALLSSPCSYRICVFVFFQSLFI